MESNDNIPWNEIIKKEGSHLLVQAMTIKLYPIIKKNVTRECTVKINFLNWTKALKSKC